VQAGGPGQIREILEADVPAPAEPPRAAGGGLVQIALKRTATGG
jgi:hypothetical protein